MSATVPSVGNSTAVPGYATAVVEPHRRDTDEHDADDEQHGATRTSASARSRGAASTSAPPSANSQARIGIRKNAPGGSVVVVRTLHANVAMPTSSSTVRSSRVKTAPTLARDEHQRDQHRRPDQVVLLLDRQRPRVQQRHQVRLHAEVVAAEPEQDVGRRKRRCERRLRQVLLLAGHRQQQHRAEQYRRREHQRKRGQQATHAARIEARKRDRARLAQLFDQQAGDEKTGDDEEHVDADETAAEARHAGMKSHHDRYGDRPQSVDVGPVAQAHRRLQPPTPAMCSAYSGNTNVSNCPTWILRDGRGGTLRRLMRLRARDRLKSMTSRE